MAASLIGGLLRVSIAGGAVYVTVKEGIWSNSATTPEFLDKVKMDLVDSSVYKKQLVAASSSSRSYTLADTWNSGVQWTCEGIADGPSRLYGWTLDSIKSLTDSLKEGR